MANTSSSKKSITAISKDALTERWGFFFVFVQ
jgi:hypothetical protein